MKRLVLPLVLVSFLFCGCVRTGERDAADFICAMAEYGFECVVEETESGEKTKESCYVDNCKISMFSNSDYKLYRVCVTYSGKSGKAFSGLAGASVMSMCLYSQEHASAVLEALGISQTPPDSTGGVARCETGEFLFSFTCDEAGGMLVIDSLRLNPAQPATVTVRTTVQRLALTEETEAAF
ncbi:MAG: hypothetical protein IJN38_03705 [Clostridia bacterium]|nr:hypothetical protein [Clostridia bacterium]